MITLKIPCKSYVRKYLIARYGLNHTITKSSFLGIFLYDKLSKDFENGYDYKKCDDHYEVVLTEWLVKSEGHTISVDQLQYIGHALGVLFREDLYTHVRNEMNNSKNATAAIKSFLHKYNITESDLKFDSVYRDYKRRKLKNKDIFI